MDTIRNIIDYLSWLYSHPMDWSLMGAFAITSFGTFLIGGWAGYKTGQNDERRNYL